MNPLQRAAFRRKAIYFAAIVGLFTLSMVWRGLIPMPLSGSVQPARWAAAHTIEAQAHNLELRELEEGDPEVVGSAMQLSLVGLRGVAVSYLWMTAIDKQKRNDFHEFELLVRYVTKLQPHFITPWIFQSWNIAYNVSVEMHSINDMYFYIARGIDMLAEGERRNKKSPDMRFWIAFYFQNKFGVSDQVQTLRCLFALSCMPPGDREPALFADDKDPDGVNRAEFRKFCEKYPHLVRRLRGEERVEREQKIGAETLRCSTPDKVVQFLKDNKNVPTRYVNATDLAPAGQQFPVLPPKFNEGPDEAHPGAETDEDFTGYLAAKAWYTYSLVLVPPNPKDAEGNPLPSGTPQLTAEEQFKYRVPRQPMLIIFRQGAARAQTYQAELEQKDGWYDGSGWAVDAGVDVTKAWFVERSLDKDGRELGRRKPDVPVVIGTKKEWSVEAWRKAADMWRRHGYENGLELSLSRLQAIQADAVDMASLPTAPTPEQLRDPVMNRRYQATMAMMYYTTNRQVTNFPYYLAASEAESDPPTVKARKTLWQADQARRTGNRQAAIEMYRDGLDQWKKVLLKFPTYQLDVRTSKAEEDTAEYELEYVRLLAQDDPRVWAKAQEDYEKAFRAAVPFAPAPALAGDKLVAHMETAERHFSPFAGNMPDDAGFGRAGRPWISEYVRMAMLQRQGIARRQPNAPPTMPGTPGGPPAMPPGKASPR